MTWKEARDFLILISHDSPSAKARESLAACLARLDAAEALIASIRECGAPEERVYDTYFALCAEQDK